MARAARRLRQALRLPAVSGWPKPVPDAAEEDPDEFPEGPQPEARRQGLMWLLPEH